MARFTFRLDAVLRHRKMMEQGKMRDVALAQARQKALEDQLVELNQTLQTTNDDLRKNHLVGRIDVNFITAHRRYLVSVQRRGTELAAAINAAQRETMVALKALTEAARERKVLETLRDKQKQRWQDEVSRKEMIEMDEITTQISLGDMK